MRGGTKTNCKRFGVAFSRWSPRRNREIAVQLQRRAQNSRGLVCAVEWFQYFQHPLGLNGELAGAEGDRLRCVRTGGGRRSLKTVTLISPPNSGRCCSMSRAMILECLRPEPCGFSLETEVASAPSSTAG